MLVKEATKNGLTLKIFHDEGAESPREHDNLGTMFCLHRRHSYGDPPAKHGLSESMFSSWAELEKHLRGTVGAVVQLPVYLYEHSVRHVSTTAFYGRAPHAQWDSGRIGVIYATKEAIRKFYNIKKVTAKWLKEAEERLVAEVEDYDCYISGDVYYLTLEDADGNELACCGGFFGSDFKKNGIADHLGEYDYLLGEV